MLGHRNTASNELLREILTPAAALRDHVAVRTHGGHGHWVGQPHCLPDAIFSLWVALIIGWPYLSRRLGPDVPSGAMQRISAPYTPPIKIGPFVFFGLLGLLLFLLLMNGAYQTSPMLLVGVGVMAVYGVCTMRASRRDCVDDVLDCGDYLLVRKSGEEDTVQLSNIINVNFSKNPQNISAQITLRLASPGKFGTEISFAPPPKIYWGFPPRSEIAEDLLVRAEKARRSQLA